ncbi:kinase-like protein [Lactarius akahatsu]|uniref:Kinase-like protein n=1 Tax=Lactarius akahatsu TaxID=416441 RepID=A0AAD4LIM9_9AGAM|nr:kinase-like protein [Lactarius akahatsu]
MAERNRPPSPVPLGSSLMSLQSLILVDRLSFSPSLSASTSFSSLPSPSFPPSTLPQVVPRPSHHSSHHNDFSRPSSSSKEHSSFSSHIEDVLSHGDIVGEGIPLLGEPLRLVANSSVEHVPDHQEPATEFQVVRKLGTGSYAVVYLVREVLSRSPPSEDDHFYPGGRLELDDVSVSRSPPTEYGREYAIKLLSKADLDLVSQLTEATIHQSIPVHSNIVTLHRTFETSAFLLLLLEFVPGQDLFYFLEQARDHYDVDPASDPALNHTPPTPGLLSSLHPSQLLSYTRLRLIASMFAQMCEAVATCHDASVFHRDIKPENFIVTDGWTLNQDGIRERKVVVKLSDFGLSTRDTVSSDMDCGSAPYMSFECRNNVAPVYKPRAADVWSLGIVLINMYVTYRRSITTIPGQDTKRGECTSFNLYLSNPTDFFMRRFAGMTLPVANFLVENVFCILDDPTDDSQRIGAREFGVWIRDLPTLMRASQPATHTHSRVPSTASILGHPLASAPASRRRRPSSRPPSAAGGSPRRPPALLRAISQSTPVDPVDHNGPDCTHPPALDLVLNEDDEDEEQQQQAEDGVSPSVRSLSTTKRRKRGRKGKGMTPPTDHTQTSERLAMASQTLVRELSRQTRSTTASTQSFLDVPASQPVPPSKWKLSFGKSAGEAVTGTRSDSRSTRSNSTSGSARATNVTNLIMGLNPTSPPAPPPPSTLRGRMGGNPEPLSHTRSGRPLASSSSSSSTTSGNWRNSIVFTRYSNQSVRSVSTFATSVSASSASSSTNWRNPQSPTFPSSSSLASSVNSNKGCSPQLNNNNNGLLRRPPPNVKRTYFPGPSQFIPGMHLLTGRPSVMTGVPWELGGPPRELHQKGDMDIFGAPPQPRERKRAGRGGKGKQPATSGGVKSALEPINERPHQVRQDAATSTTDLAAEQQGSGGQGQGTQGQGQGPDGGDAPKVHKAQINALAKMLSALRR